MGIGVSFSGGKRDGGVKLTTHLQVVQRLRIHGAIPEPPIRLHDVILNYVGPTGAMKALSIFLLKY
jgi:hypothetical protein